MYQFQSPNFIPSPWSPLGKRGWQEASRALSLEGGADLDSARVHSPFLSECGWWLNPFQSSHVPVLPHCPRRPTAGNSEGPWCKISHLIFTYLNLTPQLAYRRLPREHWGCHSHTHTVVILCPQVHTFTLNLRLYTHRNTEAGTCVLTTGDITLTYHRGIILKQWHTLQAIQISFKRNKWHGEVVMINVTEQQKSIYERTVYMISSQIFFMYTHAHTHTQCDTVWKEVNQSVNSGLLWVLGLHAMVKRLLKHTHTYTHIYIITICFRKKIRVRIKKKYKFPITDLIYTSWYLKRIFTMRMFCF